MENPPFEDVCPIQDGDFPASYVCLPDGTFFGDLCMHVAMQSLLDNPRSKVVRSSVV